MIYEVMQNLGTGDISVDSNKVRRSYTYDYLVITDHTDTPQDIYQQAASKGLPVYGSVSKTGIKLSAISIDRWDQNNAKAVPSYHLPKKVEGSYAVWKYQVTYSQDNRGGSSSTDSQDVQYGVAYNFNASIKQYQQRTNVCYRLYRGNLDEYKVFETASQRLTVLRNMFDEPMMLDMVVRNLIVSFDFNIETSKLSQWITTYIPQYISTSNSDDTVVAGLKLRAGSAKILSMTASQSDEDTSIVHVQIQVGVQKDVALQTFPEMSYYAIPQNLGSEDEITPSRVHKLDISQDKVDSIQNAYWFDKRYGLGNFSNATLNGVKLILGTDYSYYQSKVILTSDGQYFKTEEGEGAPKLDDPRIGVIHAVVTPIKSWKSLDLPKRLK